MPRLSDDVVQEICGLDFEVERLGEAAIPSRLHGVPFVDSDELVSYFSNCETLAELARAGTALPGFPQAGPRRELYHDPAWTRAAIVTCGGLCPGINDVIKALVNALTFRYGVRNIFGIRYGLRGLVPDYGLEPVHLDPDVVDVIHEYGGCILGSSRGGQSTETIVQTLERLKINVLFMIGGDGTQRAARDIAEAAGECDLPISVVGIPKTIDNDLNFMERTFGFETAVYTAAPVVSCAHDEAKGAFNGVGLVKLMGRDSGFIAAATSLANSVVNFCLVPEQPFELEGETGFLPALARRLDAKHHAVVVVAEGAGQEFFEGAEEVRDLSGNLRHNDIGVYLKERIDAYMTGRGIDHAVKYFDPSYVVRSVPARGTDAVFCLHLAENAVHAAMAGMTNVVASYWHGHFVYAPIPLAVRSRRKIDINSQLWQSVLSVTGQGEYWHLRP